MEAEDGAKQASKLHEAVADNNLPLVKQLLSDDASQVDKRDKHENTPLYVAARNHNPDIVCVLLRHGARVRRELLSCDWTRNIREWKTQFPITKLDIVNILLAAGNDHIDTDCRGNTVLHASARCRRLEVVEYLLSRNGLRVDVKNQKGETSLHKVCKGSCTEKSLRILRLLLANGADVNAQTFSGRTPLHYAFKMAEPVTTVCVLLSNGAKLDIADSKGDYPIHTRGVPLELATFLVNSVDISSLKDAKGRTMLHIAAENNQTDVVDTIVTKSSCVNKPDNIGKTPLHYAVLHRNNSGVISCLLANGANINAVDSWGQTALHEATRVGSVDALKELLADDACDVNMKDVTGVTALHVACLNPTIISMKLLLLHLADITCCDKNKSLSLHFVAWNDDADTELTDLLLKQCVDIFQKDALGHTCLDIAILRRNSKIYSALAEHAQISQTNELVNELSSVANIEMTYAEVLELMNKKDGVRRSIADAEQYVSKVLTLPGVGRGTDDDEAKEIQAAIEYMIQTLAERIGHIDSRFKCVVLHAGSMSEGTKTRLPDEFDFMFCLEEFGKHCEIDYSTPNELFMYPRGGLVVRIKENTVSDAFLKSSASNFISPYNMKCLFSELLTKTIYDNTFPKHPQLMPIAISDDQCLTVRWRGSMYKHLYIDIDIVPAILLPHWHETTRKDSVLMTPDILRIPCVAVTKKLTRGKDYWLNSMALVETCILRKLRPEVRNSYIACKALVTSHVLPAIEYRLFWNDLESLLPSYSLKMSFLLAVEKKANCDGLDSVYSKPTTANAMNVDENVLKQSNEQKDETVRSDKDRVKENQDTIRPIYYGPASEMNVAVQCADFDMKLVLEVFQRLEEGAANRFLPSIFNKELNVLSKKGHYGDIEVYIKLIRKLIE